MDSVNRLTKEISLFSLTNRNILSLIKNIPINKDKPKKKQKIY